MPEPVLTAVIAAGSAVIGGLIATIGRPWGQDWVARQAEGRAAKRAREAEKLRRLERVLQLIGITSVEGPHTATAEREERELPATAYAINDPTLIDAVNGMSTSHRGTSEWVAARDDASKRVGELISTRA